MIRWITLFAFLSITACSRSLSVVTERVEYIDLSDFSNQPLDGPSDEDASAKEVFAEVTTGLVNDAVLIDKALREIDTFDSAMMPQYVGVSVTVEALVGQVNGRPIYANNVLDTLADKIEAEAKRLSRTELTNQIRLALFYQTDRMGTIVRGGRVYDLVINDLLLSEAMSGMTKEQSYGLIAIVGQMRDDLASSEGGSQTQLRQMLAEQAGISVEEYIDFQRDQILIDALNRKKIWPKVNVTWRDIQREFEQVSLGGEVVTEEEDVERTNTILAAMRSGALLGNIQEAKGTVTLGRITLKKDDPRVREVTLGFANGLSFQDVSEIAGVSNGGVWETFDMGIGGISDIKIGQAIKNYLSNATEGDVLEPFELGSSVVWLAVLDVKQPVSLYNRRIQIELSNALRWSQFQRERERYVESLWGEGSIEEVKAMADRVTNIAVRRYQQ